MFHDDVVINVVQFFFLFISFTYQYKYLYFVLRKSVNSAQLDLVYNLFKFGFI